MPVKSLPTSDEMVEKSVPPSHELEFKTYREWDGDRPSQTVIFHDGSSSWWIRVKINLSLRESMPRLGFFRRREMVRGFIEAIDFRHLDLLDDTVTRISLTLVEQSPKPIPTRRFRHEDQTKPNFLLSIAHRVSFQIDEDPEKMIYPILDPAQDLPTFEANLLENEEFITAAVSIVCFRQKRFAYKKVDRDLYIRGDEENIVNEITALTYFRGQPNIAQLVGLVISHHPYKTHPHTISSMVITGFLLEYHPNGSLEQVLAENTDHDDSMLRRWALQTGRALEIMHTHGRTHLDIKPANVVIDTNKNAILIDISGTGGYVWEWLSPEMIETLQDDTLPMDASFDQRVATDCWAYGKILLKMTKKIGATSFGKGLQSIGEDMTKMEPKDRISLSDALERIVGLEPRCIVG
ncbi:kinase-like domain-containing protein [Aspergillus avenaceus]|uniref:Kinase-like domain-containing protein n=1 Tax=Aspergillus avenaceus TaxID=36643 RepID=A0A5N6TXK9_ASPAV|nr:kinase-like domain-containing protein [Aspergillus avenaceus]